MQAIWSIFVTNALYSKTVSIFYLDNLLAGACQDPSGNRFNDNIVKASVPEASQPIPPSEDFTAALYINGSTNLCLRRNTLSVIAPASTIGAYFGTVAEGEGVASMLDSAIVAVRSYDGVARGVFNALEGSLRILHSSIDVAIMDDNSPYRAQGVLASQSAGVRINSSAVVLDQDTNFFVPISGALLQVDYITRWSSSTHELVSPSPEDPVSPVVRAQFGLTDPVCTVEWGTHCYLADPRFLREGTWGEWQNVAEVEAYYGIDSLSPCIDSADTLWGYDPDRTLPDIGRFYYAHPTGTSDHDYPVATTVALAPAYPNPFNNTTTISFAVQRASHVRVLAYDILGRQISVIESGLVNAGSHIIQLNADGFASGTYFVRLEVDGAPVAQQRVILLK